MTISVLMSTYYKEKPQYLDEAFRSIWTEQVRKPDEIVFVEDGPLTEDLYIVINQWQQQLQGVLKIVKCDENHGLAAALNKGIEVVTGDLVARMDSDDRSTPTRFLLQEQYMKQHPEVDILGGAIQEFNDEGTLCNIRRYPQTTAEIRKTMYRVSPMAHPTVVFRKRFFEAGFRYSSKYYICEDVKMWYDAIETGRIMNNLTDVVIHFRRNGSIVNRRSREKAWSEFRAYNDGIRRVYGLFTYKYVFSLMRLSFRLMPSALINFMYDSRLRKIMARQQD